MTASDYHLAILKLFLLCLTHYIIYQIYVHILKMYLIQVLKDNSN